MYQDPDYLWDVATAKLTPAKPAVVFTASVDADAMLAAWIGWRRWAMEEFGAELDTATFTADWLAKKASGTFLQIVGWDGNEPIAITDLRFIRDFRAGEIVAWGDHAFVHPDYRKAGVFDALVGFITDCMDFAGLRRGALPVTAGEGATAPWLKAMYERHGCVQTGTTMRLAL
mgnify:CR=1 FL=1